MFRHSGKKRTFRHNMRIASLLSFVAGIVNVAGFLSIQQLTTNVTGHFAFFVDEVFRWNFWGSLVFFLYIFFFLLGSFVSNMIVEIISKLNDKPSYRTPIIIESIILLLVATFGQKLIYTHADFIACVLLFTMGLQNSLVTKISKATVRTTHLTGLFTDLGIELSQLFFYKLPEQKKKLLSSIKLRLTIISFFFLGGFLGGILYSSLQLNILAIAAAFLLFGLIYDEIRLKIARFNH
ncbi:YoaK family protein [Weeksella sp. HMSC059D05]|uniref:YoaK family protein n=2 Tax=Weeksella TaxID=1013 RepID=UPI0008A18490|nr:MULTISPECIES: YoaK family protein [Weeksella]MDK7375104.1 YoaK family protein [Weeksella virosa]OFM85361.1 hypothetical protein HMPREF2660_07320 [Weeksella sp. HMSC059D05]SUP55081.1 Predicted membrane protein [Weeksella virosa]